ncbi:MAG: outer membrane lipoprotein-sorting protein [Verrucomicrobia bacterium]|nr:outer membrane lipoprotein-sorting protein [Verrucomicrobiota bacterium]
MNRHRAGILAVCAVLTAGPLYSAQNASGVPGLEPSFPDAQQLLREVRASLPNVPLRIHAQLISKKPNGNTDRILYVDMQIDWHGDSPSATYVLRDRFGKRSEELRILRTSEGEFRYTLFDDKHPDGKPLTDTFSPVEGIDFSWSDLSLSFLWWGGGKTTGAEKKKGRFCYVVDVPAPAGENPEYSGVRMWVDPEAGALLEAEAYNKKNVRLRRLFVKSLQKVNDQWTIKNLTVYSYPSRHKTTLRVLEWEEM